MSIKSIIVQQDDVQVGSGPTQELNFVAPVRARPSTREDAVDIDVPNAAPNPGGAAGLMPAADRTLTNELLTVTFKGFADSPVTLLTSQGYCMVSSAGGPVTVKLPSTGAGSAVFVGELHTIADVAGQAGVNTITVDGNGSPVNGAATFPINSAYQSVTVVWTGIIWKVVARG